MIGEECFCSSALEEVEASSGLREICGSAFYDCRNLKRVALNEGLKMLGYPRGDIFNNTQIEEITLPSTLKEIHDDVFYKCTCLNTIYVKDGCQGCLSCVEIPTSAIVVPLPEMTIRC